jgi:hypothetical protein
MIVIRPVETNSGHLSKERIINYFAITSKIEFAFLKIELVKILLNVVKTAISRCS